MQPRGSSAAARPASSASGKRPIDAPLRWVEPHDLSAPKAQWRSGGIQIGPKKKVVKVEADVPRDPVSYVDAKGVRVIEKHVQTDPTSDYPRTLQKHVPVLRQSMVPSPPAVRLGADGWLHVEWPPPYGAVESATIVRTYRLMWAFGGSAWEGTMLSMNLQQPSGSIYVGNATVPFNVKFRYAYVLSDGRVSTWSMSTHAVNVPAAIAVGPPRIAQQTTASATIMVDDGFEADVESDIDEYAAANGNKSPSLSLPASLLTCM